jgi:hypothetical protein
MSLHDELRQLSAEGLVESYKVVLDNLLEDPEDTRGKTDCLNDYPALVEATSAIADLLEEHTDYRESVKKFVVQGMVIAIAGMAFHAHNEQAAAIMDGIISHPDAPPHQG